MNIGYLFITLFVAALGIVGNSLVIAALLVHRRLRVLNNTFIGNLAFADLLVAGIIHPFTALGITRGKDFFSKPGGGDGDIIPLCSLLSAFCVISCTSSVFSIAAVAFNRYFYICHHRMYARVYTRCTIPFYVAGIWFLAFLVDVPLFFGFGRHEFHTRAATCIFDTTHKGYKLYFIGLGILFPISVITYSYTRIVVLVVRASRQRQNRIGTAEQTSSAATGAAAQPVTKVKPADVKLLKTVAAIGVLGVIIYTPLSLTLLFDYGQVPKRVWMFSVGLMHSYSCINWCVYGLTNSNFRTAYKMIFKRYICRPFFKGSIDVIEDSVTNPTEMTGATTR